MREMRERGSPVPRPPPPGEGERERKQQHRGEGDAASPSMHLTHRKAMPKGRDAEGAGRGGPSVVSMAAAPEAGAGGGPAAAVPPPPPSTSIPMARSLRTARLRALPMAHRIVCQGKYRTRCVCVCLWVLQGGVVLW